MTRVVQAMRACRLLRPLSSSGSLYLYQASGLTSAAGCQASTSGCEHDCYSALLALSRQLSPRLFSTQTAPSSLRVREVTNALAEPPASLQCDRGEVTIPPQFDNAFGRTMLKMLGFESKRSKLLHGAQRLYEAIVDHVDSGVLQRAFQTGKTFWSSHVFLHLHVWLVLHRMRTVKHPDMRFFQQQFYNEFQRDVEYRVCAAGVQIGVTKWLKKLELHFYETAFELDQVLSGKSKDTLSDVILRKYYGNEEKHRTDADLLAHYVTRELQCLAATPEEVVLGGHVRFSVTDLARALRRAGVNSPAEDDGGSEAGAGAAEGRGTKAGEADLGAPAETAGEPSKSAA